MVNKRHLNLAPSDLTDGTVIENQVLEQHPECLLLLSTKIKKLMRKSSRAKGLTAYFFTVHLAATEQQPPSEFHLGNEFIDKHREDSRKMLFGDFP
jgi:hypothetical protein